MSLCLHSELKIHEHRCFFFALTHTHTCLAVAQTVLLWPTEETHYYYMRLQWRDGLASLIEILLCPTTIKGELI